MSAAASRLRSAWLRSRGAYRRARRAACARSSASGRRRRYPTARVRAAWRDDTVRGRCNDVRGGRVCPAAPHRNAANHCAPTPCPVADEDGAPLIRSSTNSLAGTTSPTRSFAPQGFFVPVRSGRRCHPPTRYPSHRWKWNACDALTVKENTGSSEVLNCAKPTSKYGQVLVGTILSTALIFLPRCIDAFRLRFSSCEEVSEANFEVLIEKMD